MNPILKNSTVTCNDVSRTILVERKQIMNAAQSRPKITNQRVLIRSGGWEKIPNNRCFPIYRARISIIPHLLESA